MKMHYYQHHIGDFRAGCYNMTRLERAMYRELLDIYYDTEKPLPDCLEEVCKLLGAKDPQEKSIVSEILMLKFEQVEGRGWVHERCENEIAKYQGNLDVASRAGKASAAARAAKKATQAQHEFNDRSTTVQRKLNAQSTNQEPITNNQEPITNNQEPIEKIKPTVEPNGPTSRIFAYWQKVMEKPRAQLDAKRKKAIAGRLKDGYTPEQLCKAVDGCRKDPFSMGKNDRSTLYNDIELICRDGPRVDKFIALADKADVIPGIDARLQRQINALNEWMAQP